MIEPVKASVQVNDIVSTLPGFERADWARLSGPIGKLIDLDIWSKLPVAEKVGHENAAIADYFSKKDQSYVHELISLAQQMPAMPASQVVSVIMPAYNEQDNIVLALNALLEQTPAYGGGAHPALWGVMIVVNRPVVADAARNETDSLNMQRTIEIIEQFQKEHPEMDVGYVKLEIPQALAGVGLARMVGHDLCAARSLLRPAVERTAPWYVQTFDSDNSELHTEYMPRILGQLISDNYSRDYYREAPRFPLSDLRSCPLLHATDMLWTESIRAVAWNGGSPWTAGAGILASAYAHFSAGGVFPFKYSQGVDEDLRIGIHMKLLRGGGSLAAQGDFQYPLFETDARRNLFVVGDLLGTMKAQGLTEMHQPIPSEIIDIATLLSSYRNFNETALRGKDFPRHPDLSWLNNQSVFEASVPPLALQVLANGYYDFIRMNLSLYIAVNEFDWARDLYTSFTRGDVAYSTMRTAYQAKAVEVIEGREGTEQDSRRMERIFTEAADRAAELMLEILGKHGIGAQRLEAEPCPPRQGEHFPVTIQIDSTEGYRDFLEKYLSVEVADWAQ